MQTTRGWFDRDIQLRSKLAVAGTREALVSNWDPGHAAALREILLGITRDERIMAAAACGADLSLLAQAGDYPAQVTLRGRGPPGSAGRRRPGGGLDRCGPPRSACPAGTSTRRPSR